MSNALEFTLLSQCLGGALPWCIVDFAFDRWFLDTFPVWLFFHATQVRHSPRTAFVCRLFGTFRGTIVTLLSASNNASYAFLDTFGKAPYALFGTEHASLCTLFRILFAFLAALFITVSDWTFRRWNLWWSFSRHSDTWLNAGWPSSSSSLWHLCIEYLLFLRLLKLKMTGIAALYWGLSCVRFSCFNSHLRINRIEKHLLEGGRFCLSRDSFALRLYVFVFTWGKLSFLVVEISQYSSIHSQELVLEVWIERK